MRTIYHDRLADGGLAPIDGSKTERIQNNRRGRVHAAVFALVWALLLLGATFADSSALEEAQSEPGSFTIAPQPPVVNGWDFECSDGYSAATNDLGETIYIPNGWTLARATGGPLVHSARIFF